MGNNCEIGNGLRPSGQPQLGVFFQGAHSGTIWKVPDSGSQTDFETFRQVAQTAGRGLFAAFSLGEGLRLREHLGRPRAWTWLAAQAHRPCAPRWQL